MLSPYNSVTLPLQYNIKNVLCLQKKKKYCILLFFIVNTITRLFCTLVRVHIICIHSKSQNSHSALSRLLPIPTQPRAAIMSSLPLEWPMRWRPRTPPPNLLPPRWLPPTPPINPIPPRTTATGSLKHPRSWRPPLKPTKCWLNRLVLSLLHSF